MGLAISILSSSLSQKQKKSNKRVPARKVFNDPVNFLAFGFGSGLAPKAPGTFGTLACIPFYYYLAQLDFNDYILSCILVSVVGIYICDYTAKKLKIHDHPGIVWDEFAGFFITMIGVSFSWQNVIIGFILFRIFDILKPWPINWLDKKVSGGFGIMIDDILAGILAMLCLHTILYFI
jgi:phosphatidylglycerophosphatase A